ncbi:MAG: ATP-binding cassette domain-containing protein [Rhodospirillales bacterium]
MSETENILEVRNLVTRFDITDGVFSRPKARVHAVEDVSFDIKPGETLSLVGESGCGKTTTGRTIMGLQPATSGTIMFEGKSVRQHSARERLDFCRAVQMIFQDPYSSLNPRMSVGDTLAEPMRVHRLHSGKAINARIADLLHKVNLQADFAKRFPHEFSGGQRQRVSIARALALDPKLIVCDEAVSALDVTIKAQVINLLMDLQAELGLSFLFISHDMAVVERISHRVAVMYLGRIVEIGPRQAIFENPTHDYTRKLLSAVPVADPKLRRTERSLTSDEIPSAVRPLDFVPPTIAYEEVDPGHFVARDAA